MLHISSVSVKANESIGDEKPGAFTRQRQIGQWLCQLKNLQPAHVEQILAHQRKHGGRFGEVAIALGLATEEDILEVLAKQFEYPYVRFGESGIDAELVCACDPFGEDAQSFRELRSQLMTGVLDRAAPRALAVLSPQIGDGRSYVAANLAVACAQLGGRTLLVDADMRTPRLHTLFGTDGSVGLSKLLCGGVGGVREIVQQAPVPSLFLLGAGPPPPNPLELLQRATFSRLLREWLVRFDFVVVDTPAASYGPDARVIAAAAGAALAIARPHVTRMADLQRLLASIEKSPTALAGVVMNEH